MKQFSIIIPTINEADNILLLLQQISRVCQPMDMIPEILVIDDGSTDGTRQLVADYDGDLDVRLICRNSSRGLAGAVVAGAQEATHEHIVVMDADLSHPPEMIPALIAPLLSGTHDMVIGSRYVTGGSTPDWPVIRQLGSQLASLPARMLTSVRDPLAGFFSVHREQLKNQQENMAGFKIALEILAEKKSSLRVLEIPISFRDRFCGSSKMNFSVLKEYFYQLIRLSGTNHFIRLMPMLLLLGLATGLLDYAFFTFFMTQGLPLGSSHMLGLLGAVHICYPLSLLFHWKKQRNSQVGDYIRFLIAVLLGLFLRGGVLAFPVISHGTSPNLLPVTLIASAFCIWTGAIITVRLEVLRLQSMNWTLFGTILIGYTILLRLIFLGNIELIQEEAYYWNYSQHLAAGYLDHPPVVALLIRIGTEFFGNNEFGVRFGTFICWFITTFFTYKLTKTIFNGATAFRAVILVASLPIFFGVGLVSTPDAPLIACWSGALYFFYRALVLQESRSWYWAGISLGIGLASKYTIVFLGPAVILYMLADCSARKWFCKPQPYIAAFLVFAIFSPVIWWNYENHWASFLFQSQGRVQDVFKFSTHLLLLSILILLTPTGFLSAIASMLPRFRDKKKRTLANEGKYRSGYFFCLTMALVPLSIFILFSFTKEIKLNWTGPIWLAIMPFIAYRMVWSKGRLQQRVASLWPGTFVVIMITYGVVLHYCAFGLPSSSFARNVFLYGWDDLAQQIDILAHSTPKPLLVVGMDKYRIASGLAFYRNKTNDFDQKRADINETTGYQLFGNNALMYNYWCPPRQALTRDILVIAEKRDQLESFNFTHHYRQLGKIQEISIKKRGQSAGHFYYRTLTSYTTDAHADMTGFAMPATHSSDKMHDT